MEENPVKKLTKAEKKLAKKAARENAFKQAKRDTLAREVAMDAMTISKFRDTWHESLLESKITEMQDNLRYILHYMENLIEAESFQKAEFEEERDELEEKVALLARSHSSAFDMLFGIYKKRVEDMQAAFDNKLLQRRLESENEFKRIEEKEKETQDNMQTMLFQMQMTRELKEYTMNCNIFLKLDDERSKNTELQESLKGKIQKKMEKKWGEIQTTLTNYEDNTKDRRKEYLLLKAKDDSDSKTIHYQMKKTQQMLDQLEELKNCLDKCYAPKKTISLIEDLREEREIFFKTYKSLKAIVEEELEEDDEALKNLTYISNRIIEHLRKLVKKGENILKLYRICLKYETQKEKVYPVSDTFGIMKELTRTVVHIPKDIYKKLRNPQDRGYLQNTEHLSEERRKLKEFEIMNKFWKKMGRVHLSKLALAKVIQNLNKENAFYKKCLSNYMKEYAEKKPTL